MKLRLIYKLQITKYKPKQNKVDPSMRKITPKNIRCRQKVNLQNANLQGIVSGNINGSINNFLLRTLH